MKKYIIIGISVYVFFTVFLIFAFVIFMEELEYGWKHRSEDGSKSTQIYEKFLIQLEKKDLDNYYVISNYNHYIYEYDDILKCGVWKSIENKISKHSIIKNNNKWEIDDSICEVDNSLTNTNELNEWNLYLLNDYVSRYNYSYIDNTHLENNQKIFKDEECYFYRSHGQRSINGIDYYSFTYNCDKTIDGKKYEMEDNFDIYTSSKVDMYDNFEISIKITDELNNKEEYSIRLQIYEKN